MMADAATVFRQRAWQAEAAARRSPDPAAGEILSLVALTWRELALQAARQQKRQARAARA